MPVKLSSRLSSEEGARIEIIPLIDIMFFLLAAFMLVSLSMVNLKSVKVSLPTATVANTDTKNDIVSVSVDKAGMIYFEKQPVGPNELAQRLGTVQHTNENVRVFISGDGDARHRDMIRVLDVVRGLGIQNVAFEVRESAK